MNLHSSQLMIDGRVGPQREEPLGVFARTAEPDFAHPHPSAWLPAPRVLEWLDQPPSSALSLPCYLPPTAHAHVHALVPHGGEQAERAHEREQSSTAMFGVRPMQLLSTLQQPPSTDCSAQRSYDVDDVVGVEHTGTLFAALQPPQVRGLPSRR